MKTELEKYRNVVHQKIGRNVVLFQEIELLLKHLAATGHVSGYASEIQTIIKQQVASIHKQTMGQVVGRFVENTYSEAEDVTNESEELKEAWLSFGFKIRGEDIYERRKKALTSIVAERNELIHHFLPKWDWNSIDNFREAEEYLDRQYDTILSEFENLRDSAKYLQEIEKKFAAFMLSDEYKNHTQMLELRQRQPILLLGKISRQNARTDGWTVLSTAAQHLRQDGPGEVAALKRKYGYKTLKDIMLATELFDMREETTKKGGSRLLYRVKSEFSLWATE
jgi:hypothetical protein